MLSPAQQLRYQADGFLVLPGFKTAAEAAALRQRAGEIVEAFDVDSHRAIFSTSDQARRAASDAFLASAEGIQCFFEEEAFDDAGRLRQAKALSINKIGHAMHDLDPVFAAFSRGPALAELGEAVLQQQGCRRRGHRCLPELPGRLEHLELVSFARLHLFCAPCDNVRVILALGAEQIP